MDLWTTRDKALDELYSTMAAEAKLIAESFALIDTIVEIFDAHHKDNPFARACGLALAKARNLSFGCYSLILDGLAQEAGALMRPLLETHELLVYFRLESSAVNEALKGRLPKAGIIAKKIKGQFHDFRNHLNIHASHFSFTDYSLYHVFDVVDAKIKTVQPMVPSVLRRNIRDHWLNMMLLLGAAYECLESDSVFADYIQQIAVCAEDIKVRGLVLFDI